MKSANGYLAVTPFETSALKAEIRHNFAIAAQKAELTQLTVVYGTEQFPTGTRIWVKGEVAKFDMSKQVFRVEGREFVLLQQTFVLLYEVPPETVTINYGDGQK